MFICFAAEDRWHRDELRKHLSPLEARGVCRVRDEGDIGVGEDHEAAVRLELASADVVLFLVSADLLASLDSHANHIAQVVERHHGQGPGSSRYHEQPSGQAALVALRARTRRADENGCWL